MSFLAQETSSFCLCRQHQDGCRQYEGKFFEKVGALMPIGLPNNLDSIADPVRPAAQQTQCPFQSSTPSCRLHTIWTVYIPKAAHGFVASSNSLQHVP